MAPSRRSSSGGESASKSSAKAQAPSSSPPTKKKRTSLEVKTKQPKLSFSSAPQRSPSSAAAGQPASTSAGSSSSSSASRTSPGPLGAALLNGNRSRASLGSTSPVREPKAGRHSAGLMLPPDFKPPSLAPSNAKGKAKVIDLTEDEHSNAMWADLFMPKEREDLGVHKRKVQQVADWLKEALDGSAQLRKYRRMLVLTGPVGSGKTAVMRALSAEGEMDYDLVEWSNEAGPQGTLGGGFEAGDYTPLSQRFEDFISSAARYVKLDFASTPGGGAPTRDASSQSSSSSQGSSKRRQVILIEDLPNISHAPTKAAFVSSLRAFLDRPISPRAPPVPLVLILSESFLRADDEGWAVSGRGVDWRDRAAASTDARSVLGDEIRRHPACAEIRFNPVATTFLGKALKRVFELGRSKDSPLGEKERETLPKPGSSAAKALVDLVVEETDGDLRSAVGTLQMACSAPEGSWGDAWGGTGSKRKKGKADPAQDSRAKEEVKKRFAAATGREGSLMLFHAIGRVLYNKRYGDPGEPEEAPRSEVEPRKIEDWELPSHLSHLRRRQSKVDVDALWREMAVDASTLQLYLHQNFPLFVNEIEEYAEIAERSSFVEAEFGGGAEGAWQHAALTTQYSFLQTVGSLLLHLPSPVKRRNQRLVKPGFFAALRQSKEVLEAAEEAREGLRLELAGLSLGGGDGDGYGQSGDDAHGAGQSALLLSGGSQQVLHETLPLLAKVLEARRLHGDVKVGEGRGIGKTTMEALRMATSMVWTGGTTEGEALGETEGAEASETAAASAASSDEVPLDVQKQRHSGTRRSLQPVEEENKMRHLEESKAETLFDEDDDIEDF